MTLTVSCIANIVILARIDWKGTKGWGFKSLLAGLCCICSLLFFKEHALAAGGICYFALIILPAYLSRQQQNLIVDEKFNTATLVGYLCYFSHPFDGFHTKKVYAKIIQLIKTENTVEALNLIKNVEGMNNSLERQLLFLRYKLTGDFEGYLSHIEKHHLEIKSITQPDLHITIGRAYLETQNDSALINLYQSNDIIKASRTFIKLYLLALIGNFEGIEKLTNSQLKRESDNFKKFWIASAHLRAGNNLKCHQLLKSISEPPPTLKIDIIKRLKDRPTFLPNSYKQTVEKIIQKEEKKRTRYSVLDNRIAKEHAASRALIYTICIAFFIQTLVINLFSIEALDLLGTLIPSKVVQGEYGRIVQYMFLHGGILHFLVNVYSISLLSPFIETSYGKTKCLVIFLGSGILAGASISMLGQQGLLDADMRVIGASGGIMGLLGAAIYFGYYGWKTFDSNAGKNLFVVLVILFLFQSSIDLLMPQISFAGHINGFIWGLGLAIILGPKKESRSKKFQFESEKNDDLPYAS